VRDGDFDLGALHAALDAERGRRGLSWAALTREVNRQFERPGVARRMSSSTITGVGRRDVAEGDGVLQMLRWLGRSPESFVRGLDDTTRNGAAEGLPIAPPDKVLRWDATALHAAIDRERRARSMTWTQVAGEIGCGASSLSGLAKGGRVHLPAVMRVVQWLNRPAADFVRVSDR
jgi:hypothetical protein